MKADFFIDRPVFSTVLSIIIVIVGAIGLALLPVDQYPQIVPPVVRVSASYPGADAQTVTQAVATPIEQEPERYARHDLYGVVEPPTRAVSPRPSPSIFRSIPIWRPWMSRTA